MTQKTVLKEKSRTLNSSPCGLSHPGHVTWTPECQFLHLKNRHDKNCLRSKRLSASHRLIVKIK